MAYFDIAEAFDKALLADDVQENSRAAVEAARAEQEIVDRYTDLLSRRPLGVDYDNVFALDDDRGVFLRGYNSDETLATGYDATRADWTGFAAAMRLAIADLVSHRIKAFDADPGVTSETRGARSITRKGPVNKKWPVGWSDPLRHYDVRQTVFAIG